MINQDNNSHKILEIARKARTLKKAIITISFFILLMNAIVIIWGLLQISKYDTYDDVWSISMYSGKNIKDLKPMDNIPSPIFTASNVTDMNADFVADPFIVKENNKWYLFFEALNKYSSKGMIGVATSDDMKKWDYKKIVLEEEFHLSYPYVFKYDNNFYMLPEGGTSGYLNLYKAVDFPDRWEKVSSPLRGNYADSSIFRYDNKWWIFTTENKGNYSYNNNLHLFYSEDLYSGWKEHPKSPIKNNDRVGSRSAGRVSVEGNNIIRFAQDDSEYYGKSAIAFEITKLTTTEYEEKNLGIVTTRSQVRGTWNEDGMHQVDASKVNDDFYVAAVDGKYHRKHNKLVDKMKNKWRELNEIYRKKII